MPIMITSAPPPAAAPAIMGMGRPPAGSHPSPLHGGGVGAVVGLAVGDGGDGARVGLGVGSAENLSTTIYT